MNRKVWFKSLIKSRIISMTIKENQLLSLVLCRLAFARNLTCFETDTTHWFRPVLVKLHSLYCKHLPCFCKVQHFDWAQRIVVECRLRLVHCHWVLINFTPGLSVAVHACVAQLTQRVAQLTALIALNLLETLQVLWAMSIRCYSINHSIVKEV